MEEAQKAVKLAQIALALQGMGLTASGQARDSEAEARHASETGARFRAFAEQMNDLSQRTAATAQQTDPGNGAPMPENGLPADLEKLFVEILQACRGALELGDTASVTGLTAGESIARAADALRSASRTAVPTGSDTGAPGSAPGRSLTDELNDVTKIFGTLLYGNSNSITN